MAGETAAAVWVKVVGAEAEWAAMGLEAAGTGVPATVGLAAAERAGAAVGARAARRTAAGCRTPA